MHEKINDLSLFPVLVRLIKNVLTIQECEDIKQNIIIDSLQRHNALRGSAGSTHGVNSDKNIKYIDQKYNISYRLKKYINDYVNVYGMRDLKIANNWINVQEPGSELRFHTHPTSIISGALYISTDDQSSRLFFQNPNPFSEFLEYFDTPTHFNQFNSKKIIINPEIGSLVLFPSWLKHGSNDTNQTKQRVVMSFNTIYNNSFIPQ